MAVLNSKKKTRLKNQTQSSDLIAGRAVVMAEMTGLKALADSLDENFVQAVDVIDAMRARKNGRLIVAGIGKSGHVARKMVATFASTAVPAHFVHVAEAGHGDLGMITENDVVIMISVSGESREQSDLLAYTRRFDIPLIAITRQVKSTLALAADIVLRLPDVPEAFSDVIAPTTSAINTMALGDALAESLMKRMGLTPEQFRIFHPAGKLGAQLLKVSDLMVKGDDLPVVTSNMTMDRAILMMTEKNMGCAIVIDAQKKLAGIITDGDLKRHMFDGLLRQKVSTVMSKKPLSILPDVFAATALSQMLKHPKGPITSLVVVDEQMHVSGLIRVQECLKAGLM